MKLFTASATSILKAGCSMFGILGVCALTAGSAAAENASISGAVTYTRPSGYSLSYSAEKVAPAGFEFKGAVNVTAVSGGVDAAPIGMILDAGASTAVGATAPTGATLKDAVITKLGTLDVAKPTGLDAYAAILKAAAGTNGLE
jgi:hypothetical protein